MGKIFYLFLLASYFSVWCKTVKCDGFIIHRSTSSNGKKELLFRNFDLSRYYLFRLSLNVN